MTGKSVPPLNFNRLETDIGIPCYGYRRCPRQAIYIVHFHAIHECKNPLLQLTPNGDVVRLMCQACTAACAWRVGEMIGEMYGALPDDVESDAELGCATCERRILEIHDIFTVERLRDGRMHQM